MKLRQLEFFVRSVDTGSFTAAAAALRVSQPALGEQIQSLEGEVGMRLLERGARGVVPTEAGRTLLVFARDILARVDDAASVMRRIKSERRLEIAFGSPPTPGRLILPELLVQLRDTYGISARTHLALNHDLLDLFAQGKLDVCLCYDSDVPHDFEGVPLLDETMFLVGSPELVDAAAGDIAFADLTTLPLVLDPRFRGARLRIERFALQQKVQLDVIFDVESSDLRHELVRKPQRCTIVPLGAFFESIQAGELAVRRIVDPVLSRTLSLVMQHDLDPCIRTIMLDLTRKIVGGKIYDGRYHWQEISAR